MTIYWYSKEGAYMGSRVFNTDPAGYAEAYAYYRMIINSGGRAEGDGVAKVQSMYGV